MRGRLSGVSVASVRARRVLCLVSCLVWQSVQPVGAILGGLPANRFYPGFRSTARFGWLLWKELQASRWNSRHAESRQAHQEETSHEIRALFDDFTRGNHDGAGCRA